MTTPDAATGLTLESAARTLGVVLTQAQVEACQGYLSLIQKWNSVYNLTAVRGVDAMMTHHLLDSLAVIASLQLHLKNAGLKQCSSLLDVGAGAGLPGVVIAICCPEIAVTCVDAVAKKTAFIKQAALALKLPNLTGLHARVETVDQTFDVICSRAFASLPDFTHWSAGALAPQGVWMAMKGKHPTEELAALPESVQVFHVEQLLVPGLDAERCIVWMRPRAGL